MIKVGIVGGTGYTGIELLRLLALHPEAEVVAITSRAEAGTSVANLFPSLRNAFPSLLYQEPSSELLSACDVVFCATPHGVAHKMARELWQTQAKIIDLSADFRIKDSEIWSHWYGQPHGAPELLPEAVYGLPEFNRDHIQKARLVAVPGCYPTAVQLALMPLLLHGDIDLSHLIADCKSGVSGAGRGATVTNLLPEAGESIKAYAVKGHRHLPEMLQGLTQMAGQTVSLTFVPHLIPMIRGMYATLYVRLKQKTDVQALYEQCYANEFFVDVLPFGQCPETRNVRGTNFCHIGVMADPDSNQVVVMSAIDNLVKGASGQAVQCMNLCMGLDERTGLQALAVVP